jgi:hypothetical protein
MVPISDKHHGHHKEGSLNVQDIEDLMNLDVEGDFWNFLEGEKVKLPKEFNMSF